MPKNSKPRAGSLQFWPRKRASKFLPRVNWKAISDSREGVNFLGLIAYKVGMGSCLIKDSTEDSRTNNQRIHIPSTVLEIPPIKIFSVRFYKDGKVMNEVLAENLDKELKKKVRLPKTKKSKIENIKDSGNKISRLSKIENFQDVDDIRAIVYSIVKQTGVKKKPDLTELGFSGSNPEEKLNFVKEKLGKEIPIAEVIGELNLVDVRGLTRGKGIQGPVKRFGIHLKQSKSEKGRRNPGSIAPWHPSRVTFRTPMAGQLGMFSRIKYNSKVVKIGKIGEEDINPKDGWKDYGNIKTNYIILEGSVPGAKKRQMLITLPLRPTKKQVKKKYELIKFER